LMTPYFAMGESIHTLGGILPGILRDLGWTNEPAPATDAVVYPNPSTGLYTVQLPLNVPTADLQVLDMTGRLVRTVNALSAPVSQLDLSALPSGVYFLQLKSPTGNVQRKLLLTR